MIENNVQETWNLPQLNHEMQNIPFQPHNQFWPRDFYESYATAYNPSDYYFVDDYRHAWYDPWAYTPYPHPWFYDDRSWDDYDQQPPYPAEIQYYG